MTTTRKESISRSSPHLVSPSGSRSARGPVRRGVVNPLITYLRESSHQITANQFIARKFLTHRIVAIGETHESLFGVTNRSENVCVRLFLRDLVIQLHENPDTHLKYLVLEVDEREVANRVGFAFNESDSDWFPSHTVNRKAYWIAESMTENSNLALKEALCEISQRCDESVLEVVGIDALLEMREAERRWNDREISIDEFEQIFERREEQICQNFENRINLEGDERALVFFGISHVEESRIGLDAHDFSSFLEQLATRDSNDISESDIYSVATAYDGLCYFEMIDSAKILDARRHPAGRRHLDASLVRIYDLIRGEFPDIYNLGFDIDDVENSGPIDLHPGSRFRLGEAWDGYLFFRDLNSWDSHADYNFWYRFRTRRTDYFSQRTSPPMLRITSVVPYMADPGNIVYLFGHVLDPLPTINFGNFSSDNFFSCTGVTLVNENILEIVVPTQPGTADFEMAGRHMDIKIERGGDHFILLGGFRFTPL